MLSVPILKRSFFCHENKSDTDEIKPEYIQGLTFHYVKENEWCFENYDYRPEG
jgi:hypothetical protein